LEETHFNQQIQLVATRTPYVPIMNFFFFSKYNRNNIKNFSHSLYSTISYFLYNTLFLAIYLFSLVTLLFFINGLSYSSVASFFLFTPQKSVIVVTLIVLLLLMFCFKMAIVPFHGWLLSIFCNTNYFILMLLTIPFKFIVYFTFLRLYGIFLKYDYFFSTNLFLYFGLLSMILGSIGLYHQLHIRKFLAYSTINHAGYILLALTITTGGGFFAFLYYIIIYLITLVGFFYFIISIKQKHTGKTIIYFSELCGSNNEQIKSYFLFSIILLSMAGMPPLAGFWGKFFIIKALLGFSQISWVAIFVIFLTTGISFIGYLRIIKLFFFLPVQTNIKEKKRLLKSFEIFSPRFQRVFVFICFFLFCNVFFLLFPITMLDHLIYYIWFLW